MSASTYTTEPLQFMADEETAAEIIERVREIADPRLTIIFEGETGHEVYERVSELNEVLRSFSSFRVPFPENCPTCGRPS